MAEMTWPKSADGVEIRPGGAQSWWWVWGTYVATFGRIGRVAFYRDGCVRVRSVDRESSADPEHLFSTHAAALASVRPKEAAPA